MSSARLNVQVWLTGELDRRKAKNAQYSLRAFAEALGLSPATLSQVISGKRPLTLKAAKQIATHCAMDPSLRAEFLASVALGSERDSSQDTTDFAQLEMDTFSAISDWWHYAILSLGEVKGSKASPTWIAQRLGIPQRDASAALERLSRLGLIEIKNGRYRQCGKALSTSQDVTSAAIRKFHRQNLEKAAEALENVPVESRDFGAVTLAIAKSDMPRAKSLLLNLRREFTRTIGANPKRDSVYTLSINFFPVDHEVS